jgi:TPR repeat protein
MTGVAAIDEQRYARAKQLIAGGEPAGLAEAEELLRAGSAAGHVPSRFRLAELLLAAADAARQGEGREHLAAAAAADHPKACFLLGLLLAHGSAGLAQDLAAAARWCQTAARLGLAEAQFNLALLMASGSGLPADPIAATAWLRRAAINGLPEADGCLDLLYRADRPRTWDEADTRASVALARTDAEGRKPMRFAEYYVDPALDLVARRFALRRDEIEDVVQQFFLELEEPMQRGDLRGQARKDAIRHHYDPAKGPFRPYLGRALVNFVRNWLRDREQPAGGSADPDPDGEELAALHAGEWGALLTAFAEDARQRRADAARAVEALQLMVVEGRPQAEVAARFALTDRSVRTALALGIDLLREWCQHRLAASPGAGTGTDALAQGLELLPAWLRHPSASKRARALLLLALVWRRIAPDAPGA